MKKHILPSEFPPNMIRDSAAESLLKSNLINGASIRFQNGLQIFFELILNRLEIAVQA